MDETETQTLHGHNIR